LEEADARREKSAETALLMGGIFLIGWSSQPTSEVFEWCIYKQERKRNSLPEPLIQNLTLNVMIRLPRRKFYPVAGQCYGVLIFAMLGLDISYL
jgi:hypothetical protein